MRSSIKRKCLYGILMMVTSIFCLLFFGCGGLDIGGINGSKEEDIGYERSADEISFVFDWEERKVAWDADEKATHYKLFMEDDTGKRLSVEYQNEKDELPTGGYEQYAGNVIEHDSKYLTENVHWLLVGCKDSYENAIWHCKLPFKLYDAPILRTDPSTGTVVWDPCEGVKEYLVLVDYEEYRVTETSFDVSSLVDSRFPLLISVQPIGQDGTPWVSVESDTLLAYCAVTPGVDCYSTYIHWWGYQTKSHDGKSIASDDYVFEIDIYDGEEHIHLVDGEDDELDGWYDYIPQTDDYKVSVTARIKKGKGCDDYLISHPNVSTPEYRGEVESLRYNPETNCLEWDEFGSWHLIYINGEAFNLSEPFYSLDKLKEKGFTGRLEVFVMPHVGSGGYYTPKTYYVVIPEALEIDVQPISYEEFQATASHFDEWATGVLLEHYSNIPMSWAQEFIKSEERTLANGQASGVFPVETLEVDSLSYAFKATPIYPEEYIFASIATEESLYIRDVPFVEKLDQKEDAPALCFDYGSTDYEVEFNGETVESGWRYYLPAEIRDSVEEQEFTIRVRAAYRVSEGATMLPSLWKEFKIRTLETVDHQRVENGTLYWDYNGETAVSQYDIYNYQMERKEKEKWQKTSWDIDIYASGTHKLAVRPLADNSQSPETGVWYMDGKYGDISEVYKLSPIWGGCKHDDYGISWEPVERAEYYALEMKGKKLRTVETTTETEFVLSEFLKQEETFDLSLVSKGNGTDTLDSNAERLVITRNPQFVYTMENSEDYRGYYSQVFWSVRSWEELTYDYQLLDTNGNVMEEEQGLTEGQTAVFRTTKVYASERTPLPQGEYTLRIWMPAAVVYQESSLYQKYYLKTGDENLDYWDKTLYQMWLETSIEDGAITVETFPKFKDREYGMDMNHNPVYSKTGKFVFSKELVEKCLASRTEGSTATLMFSLGSRDYENAKYFAFYGQYPNLMLNVEIKKAPTPVSSYSELTAGRYYHSFDGVRMFEETALDESKTQYTTVKVDAGVDIPEDLEYVYNILDCNGEVWKSVTTAERTCVLPLPYKGSIEAYVSGNEIVDGGASYYLPSEPVVLSVKISHPSEYITAFVSEDKTTCTMRTWMDGYVELWVNGEFVSVLEWSEKAAVYTFDAPLQSGDVIEWRTYWQENDKPKSAEYYLFLTVP